MTDTVQERIDQALTWFDANRDGTRADFHRRFRSAADMLLTACLSHGFIVPRGQRFELTIPGARRLYALKSRE